MNRCHSFHCTSHCSDLDVMLLFTGGFEIPKKHLRWCTGPGLQAAPPQPHRSSLTTECHWPPVGALQLPPSPTPHLPHQEILSPPDLPAYLPLRGVLICPSPQTLGQHVSGSLPWALNCHYSGTFYDGYKCIPTFILYSVMSLYMSSMFPRGVLCFYCLFFFPETF